MVAPHALTRRQFIIGTAGVAVMAVVPAHRLTRLAAATVDIYVVTSDGLRLRSGPGLGYSVLASLSRGTAVEILEWSGSAGGYDWAKVLVSSRNLTGFVATAFLAKKDSSSGGDTFPIGSTVHVDTVTGGNANMRSGPSITASVVRVVPNGTTGTVQSGETPAGGYRWIKVTMAGTTGWMATSVLSAGSGSTTPPPTTPPPAGDNTETFAIGATVHVDTTTGGNANLRSGPGYSASVIKIIPNGTTATILSNKSMADGLAWVKISVLGVEGWMANGCLSSGAGTQQPPSDADVKVADGPLNVRSEPGLKGAILATVPTGATGEIVEGPKDADGHTWVKVHFLTQSSATGWVADTYLTYL